MFDEPETTTTTTTTVEPSTTTTSTTAETTTTTTSVDVSTPDDNQSKFKPENAQKTVTESTTLVNQPSVTSTGLDLASDVVSPTINDTVQTPEDRLAQARAEAEHNHNVEHADDEVFHAYGKSNSDDPTQV